MTVEASCRVWIEAAVCGALGVVAFLSFDLWRPFSLGDEAFRYLLSRHWAHGDNLFERFMVLYPTGQYAFYGSIMRIFGEELWVLRLGQSLLGGAAVFLLFLTLRRRDQSPLPWALAIAIMFSCIAGEKLFASTVVLCSVFLLADTAQPEKRHLGVSAALAGFLAGWREDGAVLMAVVVVIWVIRRRRPSELVSTALPAAATGFGFWVAIELVRGDAVSFVAHVAQRLTFVAERISSRTHIVWNFPPERLPRSPLELASQAMPVLAALHVFVYGGLLAHQLTRWRRGFGVQFLVVASAMVGVAYLPQFLWERPDFPHFLTHLPVMITVVAFSASVLSPSGKHRVALCLLVLAFASAGAKYLQAKQVKGVPYPTEPGHRIGISFAGSVPDWAGLPRSQSETMIVIGWGAGWYVAEGFEPGTRFLSTFTRHLPSEAERRELKHDLENRRNRWVITRRTGGNIDIYSPVISNRYTLVARWRGWELWENTRPQTIFEDGFETAGTEGWATAKE
jgi:hypothetical protein